MTRTLKIAACRVLFLVLCVVPLLGSISFATWQQLRNRSAEAELALATQLGRSVTIDALVELRPNLQRAASAQLHDPETGQLIADCRQVDILRGSAATVISIDTAHVAVGQMSQLWQILSERFLKQPSSLERALTVTVDRVAVRSGTSQNELRGVRLETRKTEAGVEADISFRVGNADLTLRPIRIHIARSNFDESSLDFPSTRVELHAPDAALDVSLLIAGSRWSDLLGESVRFQGVGWIDLQREYFAADLTGRISGVSLQRLAAHSVLPPCFGEATLDVRQARFVGGRIEELNAVVSVDQGWVGEQAFARGLELGLPFVAADDTQRVAMADGEVSVIPFEAWSALVTVGSNRVTIGDTELSPSALLEWTSGHQMPEALFTRAGAALYRVLPLK